ncbi:MAG: hypothetical protein HC836_45715 [Richelia sp. RM2_1_2]|nr:hypothetical protein [Richelia sp. RM2_1_2]
MLTPTTKITENHQPALPGSKGSIIYADTTVAGSLTTTKTDKVAFIQLSDAVKSFADGTVANATSFVGSEIKINGITITFSTGTATIDDVVTDINLLSSLTNVVASKVVIATTVLADLSYGQPATFITAPGPATATFNSQSVTFNNDTFGATELGAGIGNERDIVNSINNAALTNIEAYYTADSITVVETSGSALTIVNTNNDANGTPFAGPASNSGLPLSNTNTFLRLTRTDGGPIDVQNITGTPIDDFGLVSSHNGQLPIALVVEQGIRKGDMYVVADITARNALDVLLGDQAYVLDKGDGEWGLYLATGNSPTPNWTITATEESAKTDSDTYSITITPASSAITFIGEVNSGSRVTVVTVDVTTAFNGAPTLTVGDIGVTDRLISNDQLDLSELGTYQSMPAHIYNGGLDHDINAYFTAGGATVGSAKVTITYS